MVRPSQIRALALASTALALVFLGGQAFAADEPEPLTSVADLRYGVALYNYYQNRNLEALSELMVAQKKGGIKGHGDNPEIMEGGFCMAYGMERRASDIFARLLDANRPQRTRDAAWFSLAHMRYLRGDWAAADQALSNINAEPEVSLQPEVATMRFNLSIKLNQLPEAGKILAKTEKESDSRPYMLFNLGAAYSRAGDYTKGVDHFASILNMPQRSEEHLALYDKAMTATGYAYLLKQDYANAIHYFSQVRLTSPISNRALLGYGWAAVEQKDYRLALKPWHELAKRPLVDQYSQEVLVALPYAYEKLGMQAQALEQFRQAETSYLAEIQRLQDAINGVEGNAIREALSIDRSADFSWLEYAEKNQLSPQMSYLVTLFSREEFLGLVHELRDLIAIQNQFAAWQNKLDFYRNMLDEREVNRAVEMKSLGNKDSTAKIAAMIEKRDQYAAEIARIEKDQDFLSLVNPKETQRIERILRAEKNVAILQAAARERGVETMPAAELKQLAEKLRKQKGLMLWDSSTMFDERLWRAKLELSLVNEELAKVAATQDRITGIVEQGYDLKPYRQRIAIANQQLITQTSNIDLAIQRGEDQLRDQVIQVLKVQQGRMNHYLAQTRLSIARLLDLSVTKSTPTPAAAPAPVQASKPAGGAQ